MQVKLDKSTLDKHRACSAAYTSVEWNEEEQALIYTDFEKSVARLLSSPEGTKQLAWLVSRKLVPMTESEFAAAKAAFVSSPAPGDSNV